MDGIKGNLSASLAFLLILLPEDEPLNKLILGLKLFVNPKLKPEPRLLPEYVEVPDEYTTSLLRTDEELQLGH